MVIIMNTEREADLILYIGMLIPLLGWVTGFLIMHFIYKIKDDRKGGRQGLFVTLVIFPPSLHGKYTKYRPDVVRDVVLCITAISA